MNGRFDGSLWLLLASALLLIPALGIASASRLEIRGGVIQELRLSPPPHAPAIIEASVRIVPGLDLSPGGGATALVERVASPHRLAEVDLRSIQLCYVGGCVKLDGSARLDRSGQVAAIIRHDVIARLVGSARGWLTFVVQGTLTGGTTFRGSCRVRVLGHGPTEDQGASPRAGSSMGQPPPASSPTITTTSGASASPSASPQASPTAASTVTPETPSVPTPASSGEETPVPPAASPSPTAVAPSQSPPGPPDPVPSLTPTHSPAPTPAPTASPAPPP